MDFKLAKNNLNFKVYTAAEAPATGVENDICIISNVKMKNWVLSPDAPGGAPRTDGDVWVKYSIAGKVFNALKNNALQIVAISAYQYAGGSWVKKLAKIYQDGRWAAWFYAQGNEYNDITGGFSISTDNGQGTRELTKNADALYLNCVGSGSKGALLTVANEIAIDFTNINKLYVNISYTTSADKKTRLYLALNNARDVNANSVTRNVLVEESYDGMLELDASDITGEHYILLTLAGAVGTNDGKCYVKEVFGV